MQPRDCLAVDGGSQRRSSCPARARGGAARHMRVDVQARKEIAGLCRRAAAAVVLECKQFLQVVRL